MENTLNLEQGGCVWDSKYGLGTVAEYNEAKTYCYDIRFENFQHPNLQYVSFDREGKDNSLYRTLFKKSKRTYYNERENPLLYIGEPLDRDIVTSEVTGIENGLYVINPDGIVKTLFGPSYDGTLMYPGYIYDAVVKFNMYLDIQTYKLMIAEVLLKRPEKIYDKTYYQNLIEIKNTNNILRNDRSNDIPVELLFKDHYGLDRRGVWEYFRDRNGKLYTLVNRIVDEYDNLIGFQGEIRNA